MTQELSTKTLFPALVTNALDFLNKSVDELQHFPKYSVIHFHAAVELFLKARLMHEHWSLIISKSREPDWDKFVTGDFQSVSIEDAALRLKNIVHSGLTERELKIFRAVTKHRNKMVHFFHEATDKTKATATQQSIVKQQLNAWYFLHQILINRWSDIFNKWNVQISIIDEKLRKHHEYLRVVFDEAKDHIKSMEENGISFEICPSCGFKSQGFDKETIDSVEDAECIVCKHTDSYLVEVCPDCGNELLFLNEGISSCEQCGKSFEPDDLVKLLLDETARFTAIKDGDDSFDLGNCSSCDGFHTVVKVDDRYICANCLGQFDSLENCEWCNEPNTGDMSGSFFSGCSHCDGRDGWGYD